MKRFALSVLSGMAALLTVTSVWAAGFVYSPNFLVFTPAEPSQEQADVLAKDVLELAEQYRKEIAEDWLGEEIPPGTGRTTINVSYDPGRERALTWAKDHPKRKLHCVYVRTTPDRSNQAIDEMLPHEMAHVVLATRFPYPNRLPSWVEEGIASRYDDEQRIGTRRSTVRWWMQTGNWPDLAELLGNNNLGADDAASYSAAASLVDFLLERGDKEKLFAFAQDGAKGNWDGALQKHYGITNAGQLQKTWQGWVQRSTTQAQAASRSESAIAAR